MPPGLQAFHIPTAPGTVPQRQTIRRFSATETAEIRRQITKMLECGVISACYSPWNAGVVLAR